MESVNENQYPEIFSDMQKDDQEMIRLPLRISGEENDYIRLNYKHPSNENEIKTRHYAKVDANHVNIIHNLKNNQNVSYTGNIKTNFNDNQEVVLQFTEKEVICTPIRETILDLH